MNEPEYIERYKTTLRGTIQRVFVPYIESRYESISFSIVSEKGTELHVSIIDNNMIKYFNDLRIRNNDKVEIQNVKIVEGINVQKRFKTRAVINFDKDSNIIVLSYNRNCPDRIIEDVLPICNIDDIFEKYKNPSRMDINAANRKIRNRILEKSKFLRNYRGTLSGRKLRNQFDSAIVIAKKNKMLKELKQNIKEYGELNFSDNDFKDSFTKEDLKELRR